LGRGGYTLSNGHTRQCLLIAVYLTYLSTQNNSQCDTVYLYFDPYKKYYGALKQLGAPIDVITGEKDFSKYPVMIARSYQLLDASLIKRWKQYLQNGGHLILTSRTAQKHRNGKLLEMQWAQPVYDLIGEKIPFYDLLPDSVQRTIRFGNTSYKWNNWGDVLQVNAGTEVWATYTSRFYSGKAAVVHRKLGKGTVTFCWSEC